MSNKDFECEFLQDLLAFVKNPIQIEPLDKWDPRQTAAPERHYMLGKLARISVDSQAFILRDNYAFQDIESILHMSFNGVEYSECTELHPIKEQVWLFGYKWLEKYLKFLAMPGAMRKEFYRRHNDRFLEILGCFLTYTPHERITFYDALRQWDPQHTLLQTSGISISKPALAPAPAPAQLNSEHAVGDVSSGGAASQVETHVVTTGVNVLDHSNPSQPLESAPVSIDGADFRHPAAVSAPQVRQRLNLIRQYDSAGRTKTRKACNSTHSLASGNHDWINRD
jgi:hypothetical protein